MYAINCLCKYNYTRTVYVYIYYKWLRYGLISTCMQSSVSEEVKGQLSEVEREQTFEELAVLRRLVMARIKRERRLIEVYTVHVQSKHIRTYMYV